MDDPVPAPGSGEGSGPRNGAEREGGSSLPQRSPFPVGAAALSLLLLAILAYVGMRALGDSTPDGTAGRGSTPTASTAGSAPGASPPAASPRPPAQARIASAPSDPVADLLSGGEEPGLLARSGDFEAASGAWARQLAERPARDGYTVQLSANCETDKLADLLNAPGIGSDGFLLPVTIAGRSCYRVCVGLYPARVDADRRAREISSRPPAPGVVARAVLLADLLPR